MRLKYLLICVFIAIAAIPLFVGLQYLNQYSGEHYRQQFEEHLSSLSMIAKKRVLAVVDRFKDATALISSHSQMRTSLALWNSTAEDSHRDHLSRIISNAKHALPHLKQIDLFDHQGKLAASTAYSIKPQAIDPQQFSRPGLSLQQEGSEVLAISMAPLTLEQQTIGYIRLSFFTDFITDLVSDRTGLGETGEWLVAVRHPSGDALFAVPLKYDQRAAFKRRVAKDRVDVPIIQALLGNERIMQRAPDYLEKPVLASTRYIADLDWGLVVKINESEVNQLVNQNNRLIYLAALVIISLALVVAVLLSIYIAGPIEKLKRHTSRVTQGTLEDPPEPGGWYEVRQLTEHFTTMIRALRDLNENLNHKVEERTRELNEANAMLERLATLDSLTGLYNRRHFELLLSRELHRAKRYRQGLAYAMVDIDHFKLVNDTYGHATGDEVLRKFAEYLRATVRESDIVARVGGEEFCLVLQQSNPQASLAFLERIRTDIAELKFDSANKALHITCSIGVSYMKDPTDTRESLMRQADMALYRAKQNGRNRIEQYTDNPKITPISTANRQN